MRKLTQIFLNDLSKITQLVKSGLGVKTLAMNFKGQALLPYVLPSSQGVGVKGKDSQLSGLSSWEDVHAIYWDGQNWERKKFGERKKNQILVLAM